jgi:hypothetical protein
MRRIFLIASVAAAALAVAAASPVFSAAGGGKVIYDSTVDPLPGNLPSVGPEAYSFTELGDEVTLAGQPRTVKRVTVTLSSWGCQSGHWFTADCSTSAGATFTLPITFNIYNPGANNRAGSLIATTTQTFDVPYRPSSDNVNCSGGRWLDGAQGCFNGLAVNVTFDFDSQHVKLPDTVVFGIAYNTSHYGPHPIGESATCFASSGGCPYDSLNIALAPSVTVGSKPFPNTLYQNAVYAGDYCDNGADGVGVMRLDSLTNACWTGLVPAVQLTASNAGGDGGDAAQGA